MAMNKRQKIKISHRPWSILVPPLRYMIPPSFAFRTLIATSLILSLPHLFSMIIAIFRFLRLVKSLIFPPKWKKASLRVSEDRDIIDLRIEAVESSMVLVTLCMIATAERILLNKLHRLMIRASLLTVLARNAFFLPRIILSCYWPRFVTDPPLSNSCRYLMRSMVSSFIYYPRLGFFLYVPYSVSSSPYRLSYFFLEVGEYGYSKLKLLDESLDLSVSYK